MHRLRSDHNPLRRRSDLIQAWLLPAAVAAFLILGPAVAGVVGLWIHTDNLSARQTQRSWHRVSAVLLRATPGPMMSDGGTNLWLTRAPARWTAAGRPRVGWAPVAAGSRAGSRVPVWLDSAGRVQLPPLNAAQVTDHIAVSALIGLAALAVLLGFLARLCRWVLDRNRLAAWEAAWLAIGPRWSQRE